MKKVEKSDKAASDTVPKVGDAVWVFCDDIRVYAKDDRGNTIGGPIYRHKWEKRVVHSENARSIFIAMDMKSTYRRLDRTDKAAWREGKSPRGYARNEAEVDEMCWLDDNRWRIGERVQREATPAQLAAIAEIIGYVEPAGREPRPAHLVSGKKKEQA